MTTTFFDDISGDILEPSDYGGECPHIGDELTVGTLIYEVMGVDTSKTLGRTVSLRCKERAPWLTRGMRVQTKDDKETGTYAGGTGSTDGDCWVDWDDRPRSRAPLAYWLDHMEPEPAEPELADGCKDTNPKDAIGIKKAPLSVIPAPFLHAVGLGMMEGALKYGRHNYRPAGIRYSVYYDALMRHMTAWWEGEDIDEDSGLPHPIKAACCMAVLFDAMVQENGTDDRPPKSPAGWLAAMNKHAADLVEKYPNPKAPFTEL